MTAKINEYPLTPFPSSLPVSSVGEGVVPSSSAIKVVPSASYTANSADDATVASAAYTAAPLIYYGCNVWIPTYLYSGLISINSNDNISYDIQLISTSLCTILFTIFGILCDKYFKNSYYNFVKYGLIISMINILICFSILNVSKNIILISFIQIILSINSWAIIGVIIWSVLWIPDARIRATLNGICYNLGIYISYTLCLVATYINCILYI